MSKLSLIIIQIIGMTICHGSCGRFSFSVKDRWTMSAYLALLEISCTFQLRVKDGCLKEQ